MRIAAKRDTTEPDIVDALRKVGATVTILSQRGVLDLLVGFRGKFTLLECKSPGGKLTEDQDKFIKIHSGCPMAVVETPEEALFAIGASNSKI